MSAALKATPFTGRLGSSDTGLEDAHGISALRLLLPRKRRQFETDLGDTTMRQPRTRRSREANMSRGVRPNTRRAVRSLGLR
jgi:hypothetical protein